MEPHSELNQIRTDSARTESVADALRQNGVEPHHWLVDALFKLLAVLQQSDASDPAHHPFGDMFSVIWAARNPIGTDPDHSFQAFLYRLLMMARRSGDEVALPLVEALRGRVDFMEMLAARTTIFDVERLENARWLFSKGLVGLSSVNWTRLETFAELNPILSGRSSEEIDATARRDPRSPVFWLAVSEEATWSEFVRVVESHQDPAMRAALCRGYLAACVSRPSLHGYGESDYAAEARRSMRRMFLPFLQYLCERSSPQSDPGSVEFRRTFLLAWHYLHWLPKDADIPHRAEATEFAKEELGRVRSLLREASQSDGADAEFKRLEEVLDHCAEIVFEFCPLWEASRLLLLAFRECSLPAVASDLRYWSDKDEAEEVPQPWNAIPATLVSCLHYYSKEEQKNDVTLLRFRTQFARFCLDRLKPNPKTGAPYEKDAHWRTAYIRAAERLCVNPDGRGHKLLHQVAQHDPDLEVQALAKQIYVLMRKNPELPGGLSPRRAVFQAFLELRGAHRLALGLPVDWRRARTVTSEREARRTTEPGEEVKTK